MSLAPITSSIRPEGRKVEMFDVDAIELGARLRAVDGEAVDRIATSMQEIGLRTPISVRYYFERPDFLPETNSVDALVLLTGAHRLAAARRLGWQQIECIVHYDGDEVDAQLWEIAENLHRAELTKAQRDEHIRRYAELLTRREENQVPQIAAPEIGYKQPPPQTRGIASKIAEETGLSKSTVERALNPERVASEKARRQAVKEAEKVDFDRQRAEMMSDLPPEIQAMEAAKAERRAAKAGGHDDLDVLTAERDELREANAALEVDLAEARRQVAKYDDMAVQFEQGGFDKVIAGKDEEIRVLESRLYSTNRDMASWMKKAKWEEKEKLRYKAEAEKRGYSDDIDMDDIDPETGEVIDG